jgi:lipopolysaccharide export system protein LptA
MMGLAGYRLRRGVVIFFFRVFGASLSFLYLVFSILPGGGVMPVLAAPDPRAAKSHPAKGTSNAPPVSMVVSADHMLARNIQNELTFTGHVHLVKGTLHLNADDLIIYLKHSASGKTLMEQSKGGTSSRRVETMVATGHVVIHTPKRLAYAGRAVYVEASHLFVLTENPVVIQNGDRMSGERITFFTRLNKSLVQGHSLMLLKSRRPGEAGASPPASKDRTDVH